MRRQHADAQAAYDFLKSDSHIDARRVGLWGTSLGAMHALRLSSERSDVAAVVVQCPIVHGPGAALHSGLGPVFRMTPPIIEDVVRAATGSARKYIPIVGAPGAQPWSQRQVHSKAGTPRRPRILRSTIGLRRPTPWVSP